MLMGQTMVANLLKVADAYMAHTGVASSTLSKRAGNDGSDLFGRLREERGDVTTGKVDAVMCVLAHNWPAGLAWPPDVPRPSRAEIRRVVGTPEPVAAA
jgi:hypothetical protein